MEEGFVTGSVPPESDSYMNIPKDKLPPNIKAYSQNKIKKRALNIFNNSSNADNVKNILNNL
jgi:hypothetical protein